MSKLQLVTHCKQWRLRKPWTTLLQMTDQAQTSSQKPNLELADSKLVHSLKVVVIRLQGIASLIQWQDQRQIDPETRFSKRQVLLIHPMQGQGERKTSTLRAAPWTQIYHRKHVKPSISKEWAPSKHHNHKSAVMNQTIGWTSLSQKPLIVHSMQVQEPVPAVKPRLRARDRLRWSALDSIYREETHC